MEHYLDLTIIIPTFNEEKNIGALLSTLEKLYEGASVIDAIETTKTNYFVVIDGDFQHPPDKIKEFHQHIKGSRANGVSTTDYLDNEVNEIKLNYFPQSLRTELYIFFFTIILMIIGAILFKKVIK